MRNIFPTIRSRGYMEKHGLSIGSLEDVRSPNMKFQAQLIDFEDWKICDIELVFLQYDAYPIPITSHQDFVDLLNSFIKWDSNKITTIKRILWWMK